MWLLLTCIFVRLLYTEYIISSSLVKITLCLPVESLKPTPRSISIFTCKLLDLYSLDKKLCKRRPEEDLIGFETESWKTQGKTSSWHPPETEENWIPTPSETGWNIQTDKWYSLAERPQSLLERTVQKHWAAVVETSCRPSPARIQVTH